MQHTETSLLSGNPRFSGPDTAGLKAKGGNEAAWRGILQGDLERALQTVAGDFAVGLRQPDGRTILAVDRFAVRSLCYREVDGQLRFAAQADALADTEAEIDPQAIFDYLYFHVIPSPRTIYKGIYRLPAGHYAVFDRGRLTVAPYWVPEFTESHVASFDELKTEFRDILQAAVGRELDHAKPACFLSGGTDSSTVAGMAAVASGKTVDT
jgi:asparagine synthase (glutamine-hydrolysing)